MENIVEGDGGCEPEIKNHCHYLPHNLHKAYVTLIYYPLRYQYHRLQSGFLYQPPLPEFRPYQGHHLIPVCQLNLRRPCCPLSLRLPPCSCCPHLGSRIHLWLRHFLLWYYGHLCLLLYQFIRGRPRLFILLQPPLEMLCSHTRGASGAIF